MELLYFFAVAMPLVFTKGQDVTRLSSSSFHRGEGCGGQVPLDPAQAYHVTTGLGRLGCAKLCAREDRCLSYTTSGPDCLLYPVRVQSCGPSSPHPHASFYVKRWCYNGGTLLTDTCACPEHIMGDRCQYVMKDCKDLMTWVNTSGVYWVKPPAAPRPFQVYCQLKYGGRTYLQKNYRGDSPVSFNRTWEEYKTGFGDLAGKSFWLGLQQLHWLTADGKKNLGIQVEYYYANGATNISSLFYGDFRMKGEGKDFEMLGYRGGIWGTLSSVVNCLGAVIGSKFTTFDHGGDPWARNCTRTHGAGWWISSDGVTCHVPCNPNGRLRAKEEEDHSEADVYFEGLNRTLDIEAVYMFVEN